MSFRSQSHPEGRSITDVGSAINAGLSMAESFTINNIPAVMVPAGAEVKVFPEYNETPERIVQTVSMSTLGSFIAYCKEFELETSAVFVDLTRNKFISILDYHGPDPGWCKHRVEYVPEQTAEWKAWRAKDKEPFGQEDFAAFVESNLLDIRFPAGIDMMQIALTIAAKSEMSFRRALRLDNGQVQFNYDNTVTGQAGEQGQLEIPTKIKLGIRIFKGGDAYEIDAHFRYRINNSKLTLWYELIRPDNSVNDAMGSMLKLLKEQLEHDRIYEGSPS